MSDGTSKCKGCGKTIVWGETPDGKKIPLDPSAPVYALTGAFSGSTQMRVVTRLSRDEAMVSHFKTCPKAEMFSGRNK